MKKEIFEMLKQSYLLELRKLYPLDISKKTDVDNQIINPATVWLDDFFEKQLKSCCPVCGYPYYFKDEKEKGICGTCQH